MFRTSTFAAVVLAGLIGIPARADACSCAMRGPSCQETWDVDAVFVGTVVDIQRAQALRGGGSLADFLMQRRVRLSVVEMFRGGVAGDVDIYTGAGDGDCGYAFRVGKTYLVYGRRAQSGRLTTSICSRTRALGKAAEDLAYLRSDLPRNDTFSSIFGRAVQIGPEMGPVSGREPVANVRVVASTRTSRFEAWTASDGTYSMRVPPGTYTMSADVATAGLFVQAWEAEVTLRDRRACAEVALGVQSDARVAGRLMSRDGSPAAHLRVELLQMPPAGAPPWAHPVRAAHAVSGEDGTFTLVRLPQAEYTLVVTSARGRIYFPGVARESDTARLRIARGQQVEIPDFILDTADALTIRGVVRGSGGAPVPGADVYVGVADGTFGAAGAATSDAAGRFTITLAAGGRYRISASLTKGKTTRSSDSLTMTLTSSTDSIDLILRDPNSRP